MRFSHFFVDRPIFASVVAIILTLVGAISFRALPITEFPDIAPPTVQVLATYAGAAADVVAETVASPIEQEINGVDNMIYMVAQNTGDGTSQIDVAFKPGTNIDQAQVLVQNRVAIATPRLPEEVQEFLKNNELEYSHARLLLRLQDEGVILRVARKAAEEHMSVEALEDLVREKAYPVEGQEKKQGKARWVDPNVRAAQMSLERVLGMRVRNRDSRGKGKILIEYGSLEDFDRLVTVLGGKK